MQLTEQIGNIITISLMLLLCIKSKDRRILVLISGGAGAAAIIWEMNLDIAVYYALNAVLAMLLAWEAITKIDKYSAQIYSLLMFIQCIICLILIVDITPSANDFFQETLDIYNNMIYLIIISIGIIASDNFLTRLYYRYTSNRY